jgi:hypothetical protein
VAGARALQQLDFAGATPVLRGRPDGASGDVQAGSLLYVASSPGSGWHLHAGGRSVAGSPALDAGEVFDPPGGAVARATLQAPSSGLDRAGQVVELLVWVAVAVVLVADRRRRRAAGPEAVEPAWFVRDTTRRRRRARGGPQPGPDLGAIRLDETEVWSGG